MRLGVVILAAGASQRMGRPKLLLPWGSGLVIDHLVAQWKRLGARQVCVVYSNVNTALIERFDLLGIGRADRIENPDPSRGMFSSIECAARHENWNDGLTHWALSLGDQPHILDESLERLLEFAESNPQFICQPSHGDRPRHPVVFPRCEFEALRESGATNLKLFLQERASRRRWIEVEDEGLDRDLDTQEDYREALRRAGMRAGPAGF